MCRFPPVAWMLYDKLIGLRNRDTLSACSAEASMIGFPPFNGVNSKDCISCET